MTSCKKVVIYVTRTFKEASDLGKDDILESMKGKLENCTFGMYHGNCYQNFTAKNVLDRVAKKRKVEEISSGDKDTSAIELQADACLNLMLILVTFWGFWAKKPGGVV